MVGEIRAKGAIRGRITREDVVLTARNMNESKGPVEWDEIILCREKMMGGRLILVICRKCGHNRPRYRLTADHVYLKQHSGEHDQMYM